MLQGGQQAFYPIKTTLTQAGRVAVADRLVVRFSQAVTATDLAAIQSKAATLGAGAAHALTPITPNSYLVDVSGAASLEAAAAAYKAADSRVTGAGADPMLSASDLPAPNDPQFPNQANLSRVQLAQAWNRTHGQPGKWIAILDTGIDTSNPDLAGVVANSVSMVGGDQSAPDVFGHGTHVAGIAAAIPNNAVEVSGASFSSQVLNVKVLGDDGRGPVDATVRGIYWAADHFASVISMSLAADDSSDCDPSIFGDIFGTDTANMRDATDYAWSKNVFVVAAAGNFSNGDQRMPASCPHVMGVANTQNDDSLNPSSSFGTWVDIAAPGTSVLSTAHPGGSACQAGLSGGVARCTGTSMATPLVAGIAALVQASCPSPLSAQGVWDRIANNADHTADTGTKYLNGRVNALKAVCYPPPTGLHVGSVGMNSLQLLWTDNTPGESNFTLWYAVTGSNNWQPVALPPNTTTYTQGGLAAATSYDFKVQACDSNGCSATSNVATAVAGWMRLTVSVSGAGKVTSSPAGITCGAGFTACSMLVAPGSAVQLTPTASGSTQKGIFNVFDHWEGACAASGYACSLVMNTALSARAVFVKDTL
jgi:thermitase